MPEVLELTAVAVLGLLVGAVELASRYRDAPQAALYTRPALVYIALNMAVSVLALALIHGYGWTFNATGASARWPQVLVAGVGAMALLRSSLFTVRAADRDIGVGPGSFLQIFRDAADREVDRVRADARGITVAKRMEGIDYRKAYEGLVPYCLALMQNVPNDEQRRLVDALKFLDGEKIDEAIKVRILVLNLLNVVGRAVLAASVDALRDKLTHTSAPPLGPS